MGKLQSLNLNDSNTLMYLLNKQNAKGDQLDEKYNKLVVDNISTVDGWTVVDFGNGYIEATKELSETKTNYATFGDFSCYGISNISTPFTMADTKYYIGATWSIANGFSVTAGVLLKSETKFNAYCLATSSGSQAVKCWVYLRGYKAT